MTQGWDGGRCNSVQNAKVGMLLSFARQLTSKLEAEAGLVQSQEEINAHAQCDPARVSLLFPAVFFFFVLFWVGLRCVVVFHFALRCFTRPRSVCSSLLA